MLRRAAYRSKPSSSGSWSELRQAGCVAACIAGVIGLVGVDVPFDRAAQVRQQRRAEQRVVQASALARIDVAVGAVDAGRGERIDPAAMPAQPAQRILHRVGVEIAQEHHALAAATQRRRSQPRVQPLHRIQAQRVPAAPAVLLVGIGAFGFAAALGLEVVGDDHEFVTAALAPERLRQRHAAALAERAAFEHRGLAARDQAILAVDDADPDRVHARSVAGIDMAPVRAAGVEFAQQPGKAGIFAVAVVLQFHQRGHVRIQAVDGGDQLGQLRVQRLRRLRAAFGGETAAVAIAVEQVLEVEGRHAHVARHLRRRGARRRLDPRRGGQLQAPAAVAALDDAFGIVDHAADAWRRATGEVADLGRIALRAAVVQKEPPPGVACGQRGVFGRARPCQFAGLPAPAVEGHGQFAIAAQRIAAGDGQRCLDTDAHAIQRLPVDRCLVESRPGDPVQRVAVQQPDRRRDQHRAQVVALAACGDGAFDPHMAADPHRIAVAVSGMGRRLDEDRVRGGRVAVAAILQVEAAQALAEIGGDDAFDDDRAALQRTGRAGTAHLPDRQRRSGIGGGRGRAGGQQQGEGGEGGVGAAHGGRSIRGREGGTVETTTPPGGGVGRSWRRLTSGWPASSRPWP